MTNATLDAPTWQSPILPPQPQEFAPEVERWRPLAQKYFKPVDVDKFLGGVVAGESSGNPDAQNPTSEAKGLVGGMPSLHPGVDFSNPEASIKWAANQVYNVRGNWGDWGEGTNYNGANFGALGEANPYGPGGTGTALGAAVGSAIPQQQPIPQQFTPYSAPATDAVATSDVLPAASRATLLPESMPQSTSGVSPSDFGLNEQDAQPLRATLLEDRNGASAYGGLPRATLAAAGNIVDNTYSKVNVDLPFGITPAIESAKRAAIPAVEQAVTSLGAPAGPGRNLNQPTPEQAAPAASLITGLIPSKTADVALAAAPFAGEAAGVARGAASEAGARIAASETANRVLPSSVLTEQRVGAQLARRGFQAFERAAVSGSLPAEQQLAFNNEVSRLRGLGRDLGGQTPEQVAARNVYRGVSTTEGARAPQGLGGGAPTENEGRPVETGSAPAGTSPSAVSAPASKPKPGTPEAAGQEARDAAAAKGARAAWADVSSAEWTSPAEKSAVVGEAVQNHLGGDTDVTLYRGSNPTRNPLTAGTPPDQGPGRWWTADRKVAEDYAGENGSVQTATVKASELADPEHANPIGGKGGSEWTLSNDLQSRAQIDAGTPPSGPPPSGGPPAPPSGPTPPTGEPPTPSSSPIANLTEAIKNAGKATPEQRAMFAQQRAQQAGSGAGALQRGIAQGQGRQAFQAARGAMVGEFARPTFEVPGMAAEDMHSLYQTIGQAEHLPFFARVNAESALTDLMSGRIPQPAQLVALRRVFPAEEGQALINAVHDKQGFNLWRELVGIAGVPQSLKASFDISAPFRQGMVLGWSKPGEWAKSWMPMLEAFGSEGAAEDSARFVENHPWFSRSDGLGFKDVGGHVYDTERFTQGSERAGGFAGMNDSYASRLLERVPGIKQSERAFTTFLNEQGMRVYASEAEAMQKAGITDPKAYEELAKVVNHARGYGDFSVGNLAQGVNALYSGRNAVSRFNVVLDPILRSGSLAQPGARSLAAKNLAGMIAGDLSVLGLLGATGAATGMWSVDTNPSNITSTDWGKVKIGNTRIDPWAGFAPMVRLAARIATGESQTSSGDNAPTNVKAEMVKFFRNKEAPIPSMITDALTGSNAIGQSTSSMQSLSDIGQAVAKATGSMASGKAADLLTPFIVNDVASALKQDGTFTAAVAGTASAVGLGTNTYSSSADLRDQTTQKLGLGNSFADLANDYGKRQQVLDSIKGSGQAPVQSDTQKAANTAKQDIANTLADKERAFDAGQLDQKYGDVLHDIGQRRLQEGVIQKAFLEEQGIQPTSDFGKRFSGLITDYHDATVKDEYNQVDWGATKTAQDAVIAQMKPADQSLFKSYIDYTDSQKTPLEKQFRDYQDSREQAGYFQPGADSKALDRANPHLDYQGWLFGGGVRPDRNGVDHTPTLNSAAAINEALASPYSSRPIKYEGLDRRINQSEQSKKAWAAADDLLTWYNEGLIKDNWQAEAKRLAGVAQQRGNAADVAEYSKSLDKMDSEHRGRITENLHSAAKRGIKELDGYMYWFGGEKKPLTQAGSDYANEIVRKYGQ